MPADDARIAALEALAGRVKAATGPDREIDVRIWSALFPEQRVLLDPGSIRPFATAQYGTLSDLPLDGWTDYEGLAAAVEAAPITASLDAALALAMRADMEDEKRTVYDWIEDAAYMLRHGSVSEASDPVGRAARAVITCLLADSAARLTEVDHV